MRLGIKAFSALGKEILIFAILLAVMLLAASFEIDPYSHTIQPVHWGAFSGDEPHYLVTVVSLLKDGDLDVRNNYENIRNGGWDAGRRFQGDRLDHHTFIIDKSSGQHRLWHSVFANRRVACPPNAPDDECFEKISPQDIDFQNVEEINSHPVFYSAILAGIVGLITREEKQIEPTCIAVLIVCNWLALIALYAIGKKIGLSRRWAMAGVLVLCFASPWLAYSRSLFTESFCGFLLLAALWFFLEKRILICALFIAIATAIKPVYVVIGFGWIAYLLIKREWRDGLMLTVTLGTLGAWICLFNYWLVGTIVVAGTMPWVFISSLSQLAQPLVDIEHGLFLFAPWAIFVFWWLIKALRHIRREAPDFDLLVALPVLLYSVVLMVYAESHGGFCYGSRYWIPLLPLCALIFVRKVSQIKKRGMMFILALPVLAGVIIIVPGLFFYRFAWSLPFHTALSWFWSYVRL